MNNGVPGNFVSGRSKAEMGAQRWNTGLFGGGDAMGAVEMTQSYATRNEMVAGEQANGNAAEMYRLQAEQAARVGEMQTNGVLANTEFCDIKNDGIESTTEMREVADALRDEGYANEAEVWVKQVYTDKQKEKPNDAFVDSVDAAMKLSPKRALAAMQKARKGALMDMFGRSFPNNGGLN